ncbi:unnamed protein product, partial [Polarella glacialis]
GAPTGVPVGLRQADPGGFDGLELAGKGGVAPGTSSSARKSVRQPTLDRSSFLAQARKQLQFKPETSESLSLNLLTTSNSQAAAENGGAPAVPKSPPSQFMRTKSWAVQPSAKQQQQHQQQQQQQQQLQPKNFQPSAPPGSDAVDSEKKVRRGQQLQFEGDSEAPSGWS